MPHQHRQGLANSGQQLTIDDLSNGEQAVILSLEGLDPASAKKFLDLGLLRGERITFIQRAPLGDPIWLEVKGYQLAFRREQARRIQVERLTAAATKGGEPE